MLRKRYCFSCHVCRPDQDILDCSRRKDCYRFSLKDPSALRKNTTLAKYTARYVDGSGCIKIVATNSCWIVILGRHTPDVREEDATRAGPANSNTKPGTGEVWRHINENGIAAKL